MQSFDYKELLYKFRFAVVVLAFGVILIVVGIFLVKNISFSPTTIEVLSDSTNSGILNNITVEISGEVIRPGVYTLAEGSRVNDLIELAGGFDKKVDTLWTSKYLNKAGKVTDGQKIYIPSTDEQTGNSTANSIRGDQTISGQNIGGNTHMVNINTASLSELDTLPGIGQVYGQKIIEQRPYSTVEELISKGVIKQNLFNKIKDLITIY